MYLVKLESMEGRLFGVKSQGSLMTLKLSCWGDHRDRVLDFCKLESKANEKEKETSDVILDGEEAKRRMKKKDGIRIMNYCALLRRVQKVKGR